MAGSLGALGVVHNDLAVADDVTTFDWFDRSAANGNPLRLIDEFNEIELVDLLEAAESIDVNDYRAAVAVKNMLRLVVHPDDFDVFWQIAKVKRQKLEELVSVFEQLIAAATARPTQQPSASSPGQSATPASSPVASSSAASTGRPGRPDLVIIREDDAATRAKVARVLAAG